MARKRIGLLLLIGMVAFCGTLFAEPTHTITIKIFDGKTGHPVKPTSYAVRVNHDQALHAEFVQENEDGTAVLTIPADTAVVALHVAYDDSMELYVNCDAEKSTFGDVWYSVPQILNKGLVTSNLCGKSKANEKYKTTAAPGELILFVRERNWKERAQE